MAMEVVLKEIVIHVSHLTKFYGRLLALDHIDFDVKEGEIFGFLGPNGAGKTTTIRLLTGLSRPTDGNASILGFDINTEITEVKKRVGVVPEFSNLYDELSALDNLLFVAQLYGVPRIQRRKKAEDLLNTFGLDVVAARSLRNLIGNLRQQGVTLFITTHYLEEADILCDRIAILVKGRIVKIDTPKALKAATEEESVIEFSFAELSSTLIHDISDKLPEAKLVVMDYNKVRIHGGMPGKIYDNVCQLIREKGIEIQSVNSIRPTLEDAFIKITGLSPTVMSIEKGGK